MTTHQATLDKYWIPVRRSQQNHPTEPTNIPHLTPNQENPLHTSTTSTSFNNTSLAGFISYIRSPTHISPSTETLNDKPWGNMLHRKNDNTVRLAFRNIKSLPTKAENNRNDELIQDINDGEFEILGLAEINLCWNNLCEKDRIKERFRGCFESSHFVTSYNRDSDFRDKRQFGGTAIISKDRSCHRIASCGVDSTSMGRWSWSLYRGKGDMLVRVVTVYRPVYSMGATSTYQQQKRHLLNDDIDTCPRDRLLVDLSTQIQQWNIEGNKLIVMGDFNEDIRSSTILQTFQALNMREAITSIHGTNAPNKFYNGKVPIDRIFVSQELSIQSCGYTPTKWGMSTDHRLLWIDIEEDHLFGSSSPPIWKPQARRLKTDDPRVVYRFLKTLGRF
jgi:hypothetical protein